MEGMAPWLPADRSDAWIFSATGAPDKTKAKILLFHEDANGRPLRQSGRSTSFALERGSIEFSLTWYQIWIIVANLMKRDHKSPHLREELMTKAKSPAGEKSSRRKFLSGAAMAAAATVAAPSVVRAQGPVTMRWQSTWPSKDIFHEFALDFARKVNDMTGGDLKIEVLPAGAVVPAFGLLEAVSKGTLDGGHGVAAYHYGKQPALALWGSGPGFGMDANMLLSWHKYGGGKELLEKLYASIGANVVSFFYGPMPTQPLGWFKKPVSKVEDLNGLKFRTVGISIDVFTGLGAAVNALPGGEIVAAMDRGLLDAAEFNNASSDRALGFADVSKICMLQSYHQNAEQFEILFNKAKYDALPDRMKAIITNAVEAASQDMYWKAVDRYSKDYVELQTKDNVKFYKTPDAILKKQLEVYDEVVKKKAAENPLFQEILQSQIAFAQRVTRWEQDTVVNRRMAFDHYFGANAAAKKI
jgi:TRAP-type mannitol/chloroaromatic compound transport system substrate-binding protein